MKSALDSSTAVTYLTSQLWKVLIELAQLSLADGNVAHNVSLILPRYEIPAYGVTPYGVGCT